MHHLPKQSAGIARYTVRVPGFVTNEDIGLGDVIKRATSAVGFQPCGGCERRAAALNRWLVFSDRRPK
jgi:hypothetical protein